MIRTVAASAYIYIGAVISPLIVAELIVAVWIVQSAVRTPIRVKVRSACAAGYENQRQCHQCNNCFAHIMIAAEVIYKLNYFTEFG